MEDNGADRAAAEGVEIIAFLGVWQKELPLPRNRSCSLMKSRVRDQVRTEEITGLNDSHHSLVESSTRRPFQFEFKQS
jgi:hypothetical protein